MTATLPTALADQLDTATREAHALIRRAAARDGSTYLRQEMPPRWLAKHADTLCLALTYGTAQLCPHIGPAPRVLHAAVWAPGQLVCSGCIRLLAPTTAEDSTCDRCRRHVRRLHAAAFALGPILLAYGVCPPCHSDPDATPPAGIRHARDGSNQGPSVDRDRVLGLGGASPRSRTGPRNPHNT
jgi:hypothetical protein